MAFAESDRTPYVMLFIAFSSMLQVNATNDSSSATRISNSSLTSFTGILSVPGY